MCGVTRLACAAFVLVVAACNGRTPEPAAPRPAPTAPPAPPAPPPGEPPDVGVPQPSDAAPAALAGTSWVVRELGGAPVEGEITVTFGTAAEASGSTGVNQWSSALAADGTALRFTGVAATLRAGAPAAMDREGAFLAALRDVRAFARQGDALDLLDGRGARRIRLVAAPAPR